MHSRPQRPLRGRLPSPPRIRSRQSAVALALALVAAASLTAAVAAGPSTPVRPYAGSLTPVTLRVSEADAATAATEPPAAAVDAGAPLLDPGTPPLPTRGPRSQPAVRAGVVVKATPAPKLRATSSGHVLRGYASWYCRAGQSICPSGYPDTGGFNAYAAAGPKLRAALGSGWRGRVVSVDGIAVKLVDWCQCYQGQSNEKLIDLFYDVYSRVGSAVTIRW